MTMEDKSISDSDAKISDLIAAVSFFNPSGAVGPVTPLAEFFADNLATSPQQLSEFLDQNKEKLLSGFGNQSNAIENLIEAWKALCQIYTADQGARLEAVKKIAVAFDLCWPGPEKKIKQKSLPSSLGGLDNLPTELLDFIAKKPCTLGKWLAVEHFLNNFVQGLSKKKKDIEPETIGEIAVEADTSQLVSRVVTVPITVVEKTGSNVGPASIGCIELLQLPYGGGELLPAFDAVGLAEINYDEESGWLWAIGHNAWTAALNSTRYEQLQTQVQSHFSYRWRLKTFPYATSLKSWDKLNYNAFAGRSCEAAVACGLWALTGIGPRDRADQLCWDRDPRDFDRLDHRTVVSASLAQPSDGPKSKLGCVGGIVEKIMAAEKAGMDQIVVAKGQMDARDGEHSKTNMERIKTWNEDWKIGQRIFEVETLGDAYLILTSDFRILKAHHEAVSDAWLSQWDEDPETGLSTGIWRGSDEYKQAVEKAKAQADTVEAEDGNAGDR